MCQRATSNSASYLIVGVVGRAVGLRGEVEVAVTSDHPQRFDPGSVLLVAKDHRSLTVVSKRSQGTRTVVSFAEVADRTAAEALKGAELVVRAEDARSLESGEYWDHDLIGCEVFTVDGKAVGGVTDVLHNPANDILVVRDGERERLIPLVSEIVIDVEPGRRITVDPPPGLLE